MPRLRSPARSLVLAALVASTTVAPDASRPAWAGGTTFGLFKQPIDGKIRDVRAADMDGDGRKDLVVLVETKRADGAPQQEVQVLRTPAAPNPKSFFDLSAPG